MKVSFDDETAVMWLGVSICPSNEKIDHMWTIVSTFLIHHPEKCILHIAHVDSDSLDPPDINTMLHITGRVLTDFSNVRQKCKLLIVQPRFRDEKVDLASAIFKGIIGSKPRFMIECDQRIIDNEISAILKKRKERKLTK